MKILEWKRSSYYGVSVEEVMKKKTGLSLNELNQTIHQKLNRVEKMAEALLSIKDNLETVYLLGDYDVDGITSSLCMSLIFDALGLIYEVYIPRRMTDGYGVSENSLKKAAAYDVIITVDNGITAKELLDKTGKKVYVIDHHQAREDGALPNAEIILDPEVTMDDDFIHYCGVGLVYKIAESLYQKKVLSNVMMRKIAFLCMLGTIADVMPLIDENRTFVRNGLLLLQQGMFSELAEKTKLSPYATATDIAFGVAPIINACGRLYDAGGQKIYDELYRYITKDNADMLDYFIAINEKRKKMQNAFFDEAWKKFETMPAMYPNVILLPNCPEGLVGIMAGKIQERTKKTTIVFTKTAKGALKGSARGDDFMNVKEFLDKHKDLFLGYGGHKSAAGMSMTENSFHEFLSFAQSNAEKAPECFELYDMDCPFSKLGNIILSYMEYEPYGEGCRKPIIRTVIEGAAYDGKWYRTMSEDRSFQLYTKDGIEVLGFNLAQKYKEYGTPKKIEALGTLSESSFRGKSQTVFELIDFRPI